MLDPYASVGAAAGGFTDMGAAIGTRYYYSVAATNSVGTGVLSKEASATPNSGVPAAPELSGSVLNHTAHLQWTAPNNGGSAITKYVLIRDGIRILIG